jgi:AraC-like DNA-binding protein
VSLSVAEHEIRERPANDALLSLHRTLDAAPDSAVVHELIDTCVTEVLRRCAPAATQRAEREALRRARDYVLSHLGERMTLDRLAAVVGMRKWGLVTLFRRHVGVPPLRYVLQARVARARTLLRAGRPAGEVALEVGFFDQSHLNRWFRRTYGVAPGEYQHAVLAT